jgi:DNA polymerase III delta prime subunit
MVLPTARARQPDAPKPWTMLLYGPPGTGKTTFGVDADAPIFLPLERSTNVPDDMQFPQPTSWAEVIEAINVLGTTDHPYRTLVIDTADAGEPLLAEVIKRKAAQGAGAGKGAVHYMADVGGGFNKGMEAMVEEWQTVLQRLERLRAAKGMNVLMLAHAAIAPFRNPDGADFDMWQPKVAPKVAGTLIGWAEIVGFCNIEITTTQQSKRGRAKGGTTGAHWLYLARDRATFWAKNRHGLPARLPLDFGAFAQALEAGARANTDELVAAIRAKATLLTGQTFTDRAQRAVLFTDYVDAALAKQPPRHELLKLDSRLAARLQELEQPSDGTDDDGDGAQGGGQ